MEKTTLFRVKSPVQMRWSDCDMLGHVNNAVYLTYAEQGRTAYTERLGWDWQQHGLILAKTELVFKKPLFYTDKPFMYVRVSKLGTKSFEMEHLIVDEKDGKQEEVCMITAVMVMMNYKSMQSFPLPEEIKAKVRELEQNSEL